MTSKSSTGRLASFVSPGMKAATNEADLGMAQPMGRQALSVRLLTISGAHQRLDLDGVNS